MRLTKDNIVNGWPEFKNRRVAVASLIDSESRQESPARTLNNHAQGNLALPEHLPELDGLRGLAILLVLIFHFAADLPRNVILLAPVYFGWSGVDLFFVLSGFLITRILLRTRSNDGYFRSFYMRRALRIFPLYYGVLAVCTLLLVLFPALRPMFPNSRDRIFHWFYLGNWTPLLATEDQRGIGHFWSLAIEEQFYWIWPFIVWKVRPSRLPFVAAGAIAAAILLRSCLYGVATDPFVYRTTFCRMDGLMAGALCALLIARPGFQDWLRQWLPRLPFGIVIALAAGAGGALLWHDRFTYTIGFTFFDMGYASLLLYAVHGRGWVQGALRGRVPRALGKYSYGIYVFHQLVYWGITQYKLAPHGLPALAASLALSLGLAVASYELMEKRFLRLKDRFTAKPASLRATG
jgi:peptidoglycan/LPS O-acetylase OafA/YrhL